MVIFKFILCPTDFSEPSYEGLKYAIELAAQFRAELGVAHVLPVMPPLPTDPNYVFLVPEYERALHLEADEKLRVLMEERIPKEIVARPFIGHGDAGYEIVRIARDERADLIVIATHGLTGWRHLIFGSVAERVVRSAACPVLTVRAPRQ
jgi:universal stress protein A